MKTAALPLIVAAVLSAAHVLAQEPSEEKSRNWHQWRGPLANGTAPNANPPTEWSPTKNIKWKAVVPGRASSTPIVWNDRVYVMTAVETDRPAEPAESSDAGAATQDAAPENTAPQESGAQQDRPEQGGRESGRGRGFGRGRGAGGGRFGGGAGGSSGPTHYYQFLVMAFDRETGEEVWRTVVAEQVPHESGHQTNSQASGSPVTDGQRIYADFGSRGIFCLDMQGNVLWERDLGDMQTSRGFGEGSSAALHDGTLVVPWDHEGDSFIVALDAQSGEEQWRVPRDEGTTWATPLITEYQGRVQVITNGQNRVRSYDLASGELIWECGGQASNPIPSPVRHEDNAIVMTGFRGYAIYSIPLSVTGDVTDSDQITWQGGDAAPYVPSPLLYKGQLYFTKSNNGILVSRDAATGEVIIDETRLPDIASVYASPVAAQDRIYITSRDGTTLVLRHGVSLEVLATNQLEEAIDASPALVDDELFLRSENHLYCITHIDE